MFLSIFIFGNDPNLIALSTHSIRSHYSETEYEIFIAQNDLSSAYFNFMQSTSSPNILFLKAGTFIAHNALLKMLQLLNANKKITAVVPLMNHTLFTNKNTQQYRGGGGYSSVEELEQLAQKISVDKFNPSTNFILEETSILIRRNTLMQIGSPDFSLGHLWSADLSLRLRQSKFILITCNQAFVHVNPNSYNSLSIDNQNFKRKWHFDLLNQSVDVDMLKFIDFNQKNLSILNVNCGIGSNFFFLKSQISSVKLFGLEQNQSAANIAKFFADVTVADPFTYSNFDWFDKFDYIILNDVLDRCLDVIPFFKKIYQWLNYDGKLILNAKNSLQMNKVAEIIGIGRSKSMIEDSDKPFIRHYTRNELLVYLRRASFLMLETAGRQIQLNERAQNIVSRIFDLKGHELYPAEFFAEEFIMYSSKNNKLDTLPQLKDDVPSLNFDLSKIKLVIWDLDETFWQGTLSSEQPIHFINKNLNVIKKLTDCGIINSICSKNDFDSVKVKLSEVDIWNYFVFPSIDWTSKASRIKTIIDNMQLRPVNVLFIDDNHSNLEEAKFYVKDLKVMSASELENFYFAVDLLPVNDLNHERLKRYKILETKNEVKAHSNSNEEFLFQSEIKVAFNYDCLSIIDRVVELIFRTNQLNYTKNRMKKEQLIELINDTNFECVAVQVKDKYGDYGYCGFYALNKSDNALVHFTFSCRVLGMGVEQFVFAKLNFPKLEVVGDVATPLKIDVNVDWISETAIQVEVKKSIPISNRTVFFKGPCDMDSLIRFLKIDGVNIHPELFWSNDDGRTVACLNTTSILHSRSMTKHQFQQLKSSAPWLDEGNFRTDIFNPKYQIIFFSLLSDSSTVLYQNKFNGLKIGGSREDMTDSSNWDKIRSREELGSGFEYTDEILQTFKNSYTYLNYITVEEVVDNLKLIRKLLVPETLLVLFLGSEIDCKINPREEWSGLWQRHIDINRAVEKEFSNSTNIKLINYTNYIKSQDDFADGIINHFKAKIYFEIADDITKIINDYYN